MVTSVIGKIFLQAYNAKYNKNHTPKEFFLEVYYPLFFGAEKYMMTAGNSPLENPKLSWDDMILGKKPFETIEQREERLRKFLEKVDSGVPDASVAVGYPTADAQATTSGQVSVCQEKIDPSEIYLSWIGAGLGVGVQGGMTILFDKAELLLDIFDGWSEYRKFLNTTPNMKGNQVNTWNGQWIHKKVQLCGDLRSDEQCSLYKKQFNNSGYPPLGRAFGCFESSFYDTQNDGLCVQHRTNQYHNRIYPLFPIAHPKGKRTIHPFFWNRII